MAERSFRKEVEKLRLGDGEIFEGEGILAVTKALLQSGVAYVGGYQGSPISHLMDVFSDADPLLRELGVHFESNASEASAAAMLAASVNYPLRGAVAWKSVVGTNVASDALSNIASGGVTGAPSDVGGRGLFEGLGFAGQAVQISSSVPAMLVNQSDSTQAVVFRNFVLDGANTRTIGVTGSFRVGVGATIDVAANQAPGVYSAQFTVTADYQ